MDWYFCHKCKPVRRFQGMMFIWCGLFWTASDRGALHYYSSDRWSVQRISQTHMAADVCRQNTGGLLDSLIGGQ